MKLPDDKSNNADDRTQIDTQASEQNFNRTGGQQAFTDIGAASSGPGEAGSHSVPRQF